MALGSFCILFILTQYVAIITCFIPRITRNNDTVFTLLLDKLIRAVFSLKLSNLNCF